MYRYSKIASRGISASNDRVLGETIEHKVERMISNKEPIKDGAPLIYTDRKDGVQGAYNIRTDRFEIAADYMDKLHKSKTAERDSVGAKVIDIKEDIKDVDGEAESVDAT